MSLPNITIKIMGTDDEVFPEDAMSSGKTAKRQNGCNTCINQARCVWSNLTKSFLDGISPGNFWYSLTKPMPKYVNENLGGMLILLKTFYFS